MATSLRVLGAAPLTGRQARVLIVEPEPMVARILAHKLRREGHDVACAAEPDRARAVLATGCDVALIAVDGGGRAGLGADALHPLAGWLAVVDGRDHDAALGAMREGAAGVIAKPFKPTAVAAQVRALLDLAGR